MNQVFRFEVGWLAADDLLTQAMLRRPWLDDPTANAAVQWLVSGPLPVGGNWRLGRDARRDLLEDRLAAFLHDDSELAHLKLRPRDWFDLIRSREGWMPVNVPAFGPTTGLLLATEGTGKALLQRHHVLPAPVRVVDGRPEWASAGDSWWNLGDDTLAHLLAGWLPVATAPDDQRLNLWNTDAGWRKQKYRFGRYPLRGPESYPLGGSAPRWRFALGSGLLTATSKLYSELLPNPPPGELGGAVSHALRSVDQVRLAPREDAFMPLFWSFVLNSAEDAGVALGAFASRNLLDPVLALERVVKAARAGVAAAELTSGTEEGPRSGIGTDLSGLDPGSGSPSFGGSVLGARFAGA